MKKISNSFLKNFLIIFTTTILIELLFRILSNNLFFGWAIARISVYLIMISLLVSFISSFFKNKISIIINLVLVFIFNVYSFLQLGFNNFIGVYMSLNTTSQLGAVKDYVREFIKSFNLSFYLIFIPFILIVLYYIFLDKRVYIEKPELKKEVKKKYIFKKIGVFASLFVSVFLIYYSTLTIPFMQNKYQLKDNLDLAINPLVPSTTINELGVLKFSLSDLRTKFFPIEEKVDDIIFNDKQGTTDNERKVADEDTLISIAKSEQNPTYKNLNNYFLSQNITEKNNYTGLFKDKNVIVIMMESVNDIFINPELYPNFYKLYSEGWHWKNNYSPRNSCSTGNNELSGMTGLYSIYNSCTANIYKNNTYFTSIFNLFNKNNYYTTSMHDYTEAYYYRSTIHSNAGSQRYYGVNDLNIPYQNEYRNWASDEDFMNKFLEIMDSWNDEKPFMTWLTTVSSHQPYSVSSILGDKYLDLLKDYDYPMDLKRYMSKLKVLDNGLGVLIKGLEERGKLSDTVIVLYGDHYPYGLSNSTISKVLSYDLANYEVERVPFVIYNSEIEAEEFPDYTSYVNIVPTIANLCDLDYDPRLYMGHDLLSSDYESMVIFADGSWKNSAAYYNAASSKLTTYQEGVYTESDILAINEKVHLKISMSNSAIKNNYFAYLENRLDDMKNNDNNEEMISQASH